MHRYAAHHDSAGWAELQVYALWSHSRSRELVGGLSAHPDVGNTAIAALRWHTPLFAGSGASASDHVDICARKSPQLVWQLGADLRQVWISGAGGEWIGNLN